MPELADFIGLWRLSRIIEDARAGHLARFEGQARLSEGAGGLVYAETGALRLPGQPAFTATRRYLWRAGAAGIDIFFEDGRFFHAIRPGTAPKASHDCPPDRYAVAYDFAHWPLWSSRWRVTGPRKDYVMVSRYAPDGACEGAGPGAQVASLD
ncbi:hypothetical protein SAMN05444722_1020 [Rhodovulum sp. ES.010]|uniref:DUF6314 family protein n=1 Tax=Rhodovulum sp. ES.010 TaxID=1882821 RepID=UPI00092AD9C2|nr:DUF6314 family protein [Rhodovulum sp. ES.010]SIO24969.1 hypothetical protein SAMN05444722_1020 [Rhodovulum sp. ES.010]